MAVDHRDLACVVSNGDRKFSRGILQTEQHICQNLRSIRGRTEGFDQSIRVLIGCVAGNRPSAEVNADNRLAECGGLRKKCVLAGGQIDVGRVNTFTHGGNGAGTVLAAERRDDQVC